MAWSALALRLSMLTSNVLFFSACMCVQVFVCVLVCSHVCMFGEARSWHRMSLGFPALCIETGTSLEHRGHSFGNSKKTACSRGPFALPALGTTPVGSYLRRLKNPNSLRSSGLLNKH